MEAGRRDSDGLRPEGLDNGRKRRSQSREELTAIAIDCFARYGYQATSVERIARMAGVTKGAIYYHFRDKEALLAAAVAERVEAFEKRVQRACENAGCPEALRRIAAVCVEHAESNDHPRFAITLMVESIDNNAAISAQFRDMMRRFRAFLRNLIQEGQKNGEVGESADATAIAAAYTSNILGAEIQFYQDPERFAFRESIERFLDQLMADLSVGAETVTD
jgi:TetR/AcrR family acrAB operon transcriptional repressor